MLMLTIKLLMVSMYWAYRSTLLNKSVRKMITDFLWLRTEVQRPWPREGHVIFLKRGLVNELAVLMKKNYSKKWVSINGNPVQYIFHLSWSPCFSLSQPIQVSHRKIATTKYYPMFEMQDSMSLPCYFVT